MKYIKEIQTIRKESKPQILEILQKKSLQTEKILQVFEAKFSKGYDKSIMCTCGKNKGNNPEWKHQIRWAILDLKYTNQIIHDVGTKKYSLNTK